MPIQLAQSDERTAVSRFVAREQELLQARGSRPPDTERALQARERHKILGPADCVQTADFI